MKMARATCVNRNVTEGLYHGRKGVEVSLRKAEARLRREAMEEGQELAERLYRDPLRVVRMYGSIGGCVIA